MATSFNHYAQLATAFHEACKQIVIKTAHDCQANIQAHIRANGQIDTGFMVNSVYTVTSEGSSYSGGTDALPEVQAPENDTTAYVGVAASYGYWQNYGTTRLPARPFFEPGIEETRASFEAACAAIEDKMRQAGI